MIQGGANRLEVCLSLKDDGVTPSNGLLVAIHDYLKANRLQDKVQLFAMIRRGGDFVYSKSEVNQMIAEINQIKALEIVSGFVFGALNEDGCLDIDTCERLLNECSSFENTFHRAIDQSKDPYELLEQIIGLGFKRVITSGQADKAFDGLDVIKKLIEINQDRIKLCPASGITDSNLEQLIQHLDAKTNEYHCSAKVLKRTKMVTDTKQVFNYYVTSEQTVLNLVSIGKKHFPSE